MPSAQSLATALEPPVCEWCDGTGEQLLNNTIHIADGFRPVRCDKCRGAGRSSYPADGHWRTKQQLKRSLVHEWGGLTPPAGARPCRLPCMSKFHERLKFARAMRFGQANEAAEYLGIPLGTYGNWEAGSRNPKVDAAKRLATVFGVPFTWLQFGEDPTQPDARARP